MLLLFKESFLRYCDNFFIISLNGAFITISILLKKAFLGFFFEVFLHYISVPLFMEIPSSWSISLMSSFSLANVGELDTILFLLISCNLSMFSFFFLMVLFYVFYCKKFPNLIPVYPEFSCLYFRRSNGH